MAKYHGVTILGAAKLECNEAEKILKHFHVPRRIRNRIKDMIYSGYFQFSQSNEFHNRVGEFLKDVYGIDVNSDEVTKAFMKWDMPEHLRQLIESSREAEQ